MCGICGALRTDGEATPPLDRATLAAMTQMMVNRGPDDEGLVLTDGAAIGARRLSIIDVEGGHQPFADESGRVWGAQNGEIYNHAELSRGLRSRGHVLRSRCDTEILPHLFQEDGPALTDRLRGMFGLVVWDAEARRGVVARDRLGIKPMFYAHVGSTVVFASELRSLLASGLVSGELDHEAIAAYLMLGYVPAPMTALRDVRKLMPGERLVVEPGSVRVERWWSYPEPDPDPVHRSDEEWAERVLAGLDEAVRLRLMSDVPLGAMLSGGLDSSLIVALMARHMSEPVDTFSVGLPGEHSELPDARRVASALGARHHELELTEEDADLRELAWSMDEPVADLSALGFTALCRLARRHVTVALTGQGADELFGGYRRHRVAAAAGAWQRLPAGARGLAAGAVAARGGPRGRRLATALQTTDPAARLIASSGLVAEELRGSLFDGALAEHADAGRRVITGRLNGYEGGPLESALYLDAKLGLVDDMLHYFDRSSMACSLEVRVPFLDHEFVEACARIPGSVKVRRLRGKNVLKLAARGLVPDFVLAKRKQGFFNEAVGGWIAGSGAAAIDDVLLADSPRLGAVIDPAKVRGLVGNFRAGARQHDDLLLALLMLELWLSTVLPRALSTGAAPELARCGA